VNEIYGGRLPFLQAMNTDTAPQDAFAPSAYADLRSAIVISVTGIASETLDVSRVVQIVDKWQLLVLFDTVNTGLYDRITCVQDLGDAMAHRCTSAHGDCCVIFAGLRQSFVRPGHLVSYYSFDNFDSHPFHATSTPAGQPPAISLALP
jgi:hypothetical protein